LSLQIEVMKWLDLVLLFFHLLDLVHDACLPVIVVYRLWVQVGLMALLLIEDTLVGVSLLSPLLHSDALLVVLHIFAKSLRFTINCLLSRVLVNTSLTSGIIKADLQSFLRKVVFWSDGLDFSFLSLAKTELWLNIWE
jgi:hypothetical protein